MEDKRKTSVYSRNTIEFVTVAAEYCAYIEGAESRARNEFIATVLKILPLLYLKASLLEQLEGDEDYYAETFVTEHDYEFIRLTLAGVMADCDDYLDLCNEDVRFNDESVMKTVSEDLSDIYQAMKNFVETYRLGIDDNMYEALVEVSQAFSLYWGQTLVNAMRALHRIKYSHSADEDEMREEDEDFDEL